MERTPLQRAKGSVRNHTQTFLKFKHKEPVFDPRDRFRPLKSNFIGSSIAPSNGNLSDGSSNGTYSGINSPQEIEKASDNVKLLPMSTKASSEESSIEYGKRFLPPLWVDIQEEIERHIDEIEKKRIEVKKLQQKRLKVNFVDDEDEASTVQLQRSIINLTSEITDVRDRLNMIQLVKASESKLKELMKVKSDDKYDEQIRKNIQTQIGSRLKEITLKLRKNEKKHYLKVQEIHDDGGKFQTHKEREQFLNDTSAMELAQEEDELDMTHRVKNKEIKNLVNTINDLAVLFKDLSVLVIEQGTILDRIDYNIETAHKDVVQANVHLVNTVKIEKSARSKGVMICLIVSIIVCVLFLLLKHT